MTHEGLQRIIARCDTARDILADILVGPLDRLNDEVKRAYEDISEDIAGRGGRGMIRWRPSCVVTCRTTTAMIRGKDGPAAMAADAGTSRRSGAAGVLRRHGSAALAAYSAQARARK